MGHQRESHFDARTVADTWAEAAVIVRTGGDIDDNGYWVETETRSDVMLTTAPPPREDSRVRQLIEGGVLLEALRLFWTIDEVSPATDITADEDGDIEGGSAGDIIEWGGERWRVQMTDRWDGMSETMAVRIEGQ